MSSDGLVAPAEPPAAPTADLGWATLGASVTGASHERVGAEKQDAIARLPIEGGWILAVADGAGSSRYGGDAAWLVVETAVAAIERALDREPLTDDGLAGAVRQAIEAAHAALLAHAGTPLHEWHTTLTVAVLTGETATVGQVGDGVAVGATADGYETLCPPQRGEYANEMISLARPGGPPPIDLVQRHDLDALLLMTDGLLRLAFTIPGYAPSPAFFDPIVAFAREAAEASSAVWDLAAFLTSSRVRARTEDDLTLIVATRPA